MTYPTGEQYEIRHGDLCAVVTEVDARLRSLSVGEVEFLATHAATDNPKGWEGAHLLPWPNRIRDGRYSLGDVEYQLPINEPARNNANHGLNVGLTWDCLDHQESSITQRTTIWPRRGWPGILNVEITHSLNADGLRVEVRATNIGKVPLPWGYGAHPYFRFDDVAEVSLHVPFDAQLSVDPQRLLPVKLGPIQPRFDFTTARLIGDVELDVAYTDPLQQDWQVTVAGQGRTVVVWGEASTQWVQVFTAPLRDSIAIEAMTCGPNAFNEGPTRRDRIVLRPGDSTTAIWGVMPSLAG